MTRRLLFKLEGSKRGVPWFNSWPYWYHDHSESPRGCRRDAGMSKWNLRRGGKCVTLLTQVILKARQADQCVRTSLMCADKKEPQCSSVTTGTYQPLCFSKACGKQGKAHKTGNERRWRGTFYASFLWPEASLNSCHCRKILHRCSSIHVTFPVDYDLTFRKNKELPPRLSVCSPLIRADTKKCEAVS